MDENDGHGGLSLSDVAHSKLDRAKTGTVPLKLRETTTKTTELLGNLKISLDSMSDFKRTKWWCEMIDQLQKKSGMPRIVIGVLGDTGSGKSSAINAVLDEERVVPTNCMRACTAVITEISWNNSDDPTQKYRAEIDFITQGEWTQELLQLYRDLFDSEGRLLSTDIRNPDSEAGSAYATLRAVYPQLNDEEFEQSHPTALANHPSIKEVIGAKMVVADSDPDKFYTKIQSFVDSEEKSSGSNGRPQERKMAFWPLIRVVRVFLKSEILSTGVVLVDLKPGGRDSNSTRAAVAAKYIKECTRLWVVAPINRAVDDKTAKTLMGTNFKQQLKYDGAYSSITFICTKADDIALDEAAETLGVKGVIRDQQERYETLQPEINSKKKQLKMLESQKRGNHAHYKAISTEHDLWQGIELQAARGERPFTPYKSPRKRKRRARNSSAEATQLKGDVESSDTEESDDEDELARDLDDSGNQREVVSAEDALAKVNELKELKKAMRNQKHQLVEQINQLKETIDNLVAARTQLKVSMYHMCIQGRNMYSREEIQKDFGIGLRELDDELIAEQQGDDASQNIQESTNYEQIGRELAVFCISSRGYQQLRGRMKKDTQVLGFTSLDDTEVPGLRNHTLSLTADIQACYFKSHLNDIGRVLQGLDLFLAGDEASLKLSEAERKEECQFLKTTLKNLYKNLKKDMAECMSACQKAVQGTLVRAPQGASNASAKAVATVRSWGADPKAGGLRFPTYRATCRRRGIFKGAAGPRDFNEELLKPLKNRVAHSWNTSFNVKLPAILDDFAAAFKAHIDEFHRTMESRRFLLENSGLVQGIFAKQVTRLADKLEGSTKNKKLFVADSQKEANRCFVPVVSDAMRPAYDYCAQQRGAGCFFVIKDYMETHVKTQRATMFKKAADKTSDAAQLIMKRLDTMIRDEAKGLLAIVEQDYTTLIGTVATESDKRVQKMLKPVLTKFYRELIDALTLIEEEIVIPIAEVETKPGGNGSDDEYQLDEDIVH